MFPLTLLILMVWPGFGWTSFVPTDNIHIGFNMEATLLRNCLLYPSVMSPNLIEANKDVEINFKIHVNQFHDLDAVSRTFSLTGVFELSWNIPCVKRLYQNRTSWPNEDMETLLVDPGLFWKPRILHRSGYSEINLQNWEEIFMTVLMKDGEFHEYFTGIFTMLCPMDFKKFPFDKQTCTIHLTSVFGSLVRFGNTSIELLPGALQDDMNWNLNGHEIKTVEKGFDQKSEAFLLFQFERKPYYYVSTLTIPMLALHFLILVAYFLPPDSADRTVYTATIELAFYFFQIEFNRALPQSSSPIYAQVYLSGMLICCTVITIYSAILCFIANTKPKLAKKKVSIFGKHFELIYVVDFLLSLCLIIVSELLAIVHSAMSMTE